MAEVVKYRKSIRVLHWIHTGSFILLFLTGLILFVPGLGFLAEDSWTRVIHRVGAVLFIVIPLIYLVISPRGAMNGLKKAFTWNSADLGWLKAAPRYYFLGDDSGMPPQGEMNSGQKVWWLITIVFGLIFVATGLVMWFGKTTVAPGALEWMVLIHDIAMIVTGAMFLLHIYLGVFHPMMTEAWKSMSKGTVSSEYAKSHHAKWYAEISRDKEE